MTPDQIIDEAESVCSDYSISYPTTKSVMYLRMSQCQKRMFVDAADVDQEYYGMRADLTLDGSGCADLSRIDELHAAPVERVDDLKILEANDPADIGRRVNLVSAYEAEVHYAPRVTLRSHVIESVGDDLAGVTKLRMLYTRRPRTIGRNGLIAGATAQRHVELESPWDYLLVWDLANDLIRRSDEEDKARKGMLQEMVKETFTMLKDDFLMHVAGFAHKRQDRHS